MNQTARFLIYIVFFVAIVTFSTFAPVNGQENQKPVGMKPEFVSDIGGQTPTSNSEDMAPNLVEPSDEGSDTKTGQEWIWRPETILALSVIGFSLLVLYVQYHLVMKDTVDWTPNAIIRFFGLTLIINGGVLLVVAGFSSQQIAGVLGLLGSIAGYLLGASSKGSTDGDSRTAANSRASSTSTDSGES